MISLAIQNKAPRFCQLWFRKYKLNHNFLLIHCWETNPCYYFWNYIIQEIPYVLLSILIIYNYWNANKIPTEENESLANYK